MDKNLFFYELEGRGYTFENMTWLGNCFEDDMLNMAWEMWSSAKHSVKAQAVPEGFVLVPKKPDVDKAWSIALKRIVPPPKTNDAIQKELMYKKYVDDLYSEQDRILLDYEAMIEAQEQK